MPVTSSVVADLATPATRGRYLGLSSATWNLCALVGPLVGGALLQSLGRVGLWSACGALGVVCLLGRAASVPALERRLAGPAAADR